MQGITPTGRVIATITALTFAGGGLLLLLGPALLTPSEWTTQNAITILTVCGTIFAGEVAHLAAIAKRKASAAGFAAVFLIGTLLVVSNSVGRQAEISETNSLSAEQVNRAITDKQNDLDDARNRLIKAQNMVELHTKGGFDPETGKKVTAGCRKGCDDWKVNRGDLVKVVKTLEAELAALGPQKPVNAKAEKLAEVAFLFGADKTKATAIFALIEPFLWTLFFEAGAVVAIGFLFRGSNRPKPHEQRATVTATVAAPVANDDQPLPPKGGNRRTVATRAAAEADVIRLLGRGEALPSQDTLASRWGVHPGTASKWLADFERRGIIVRKVEGRCKRVAAA